MCCMNPRIPAEAENDSGDPERALNTRGTCMRSTDADCDEVDPEDAEIDSEYCRVDAAVGYKLYWELFA